MLAQSRLHKDAQRFVAVLFFALAATFVVSTVLVLREFGDYDPMLILGGFSNQFVFFPTLGIVALAAFYVPATIFTDLYWHGTITKGRQRFGVGFLVVVALSFTASEYLNGTKHRSLWELAPAKLQPRAGTREVCRQPAEMTTTNSDKVPSCRPVLLDAFQDLRTRALSRVRLSPFARECNPDALVEPAAEQSVPRYCFPAHRLLDARACCIMQRQLRDYTFAEWSTPGNLSAMASLDRFVFLPIKCFFLMIILLIGILLIVRKRRLSKEYPDMLPAMERGLQIGALAMLPWLLMDYAQQLVTDVLYSPATGFPLRASLVLVPWALLLAGYFADRIQIELVRIVQLVSGIISFVAILNYRNVFDWSAKVLGVGAQIDYFVVLVVFSLMALLYLLRWIPGALRGEDKGKDDDVTPTDASAPTTS